jgi:hypothetical protein
MVHDSRKAFACPRGFSIGQIRRGLTVVAIFVHEPYWDKILPGPKTQADLARGPLSIYTGVTSGHGAR